MRLSLAAVVVVCGVGGCAMFGQGPGADVTGRIAAQNAVFAESFEAALKASPRRATAIGDYRYNDQLEDDSPGAICGE